MVLIHIAIVLLKLENQVMLAGSYAAKLQTESNQCKEMNTTNASINTLLIILMYKKVELGILPISWAVDNILVPLHWLLAQGTFRLPFFCGTSFCYFNNR